MPNIIFIEHDGTEHAVSADTGLSLMEAATSNGVPGIDADCGGQCACATCHIFLPEDQTDKRDEMEADMLSLAEGVNEQSRLACQVEITDALEGLRVKLPESQH